MKEKTLKIKCDVSLLNKKVIKYVDDELDKLCNHTNSSTMKVISEHITELIDGNWFAYSFQKY